MRRNHITLSVADVQETRSFLERYFDLRFMGARDASKIVVALDENDCIIALSNFSNSDSHSHPAAFHIGFNLPSRAEVDAMHERLTADGYKVAGVRSFTARGPSTSMRPEALSSRFCIKAEWRS